MIELFAAFVGGFIVGLSLLMAIIHDGKISHFEGQLTGWLFAFGFTLFIVAMIAMRGGH